MSGTPISDREIKSPALRRNWLATPIIAAVTTVFCLVLPVQPDLWWLLPMLYASVAVHEVGHLLARTWLYASLGDGYASELA